VTLIYNNINQVTTKVDQLSRTAQYTYDRRGWPASPQASEPGAVFRRNIMKNSKSLGVASV
jgi:hypothetical protein